MAQESDALNRLLNARENRRRAGQIFAAAAGSVLLLKAGASLRGPLAIAQDDDRDSGHGRGRGRGRGRDDDISDPGNAGERDDDEREQPAEIPPGSLEVRIVGDDAGDFVPGDLTVDVGQSVTFVNIHSDEHTATGSGFDTGIIPDEGGTATVALDTPGVFPYACLIHSEMTGVIRVRDESGLVPETQTSAQTPPADATTVVIANLAYDPASITIPTGTTVAWTNEDSVPHTVTSTNGVFDSGIFDPGGNFAFTFNEPGSFAYACQLHPQMQGTITAEGEPVAGGSQPAQPAAADVATPIPSEVTAEGAPLSTPVADSGRDSIGPDGVWILELVPDNDVILGGQQVLIAFHADGMLEADFAAAPGSGIPANLITSGQGEWLVQDGNWGLALAALMSDVDQRFAATVMIDGRGELSADGVSLEGTFDFEVVGADGQVIGQGSGTFSGQPFPLDP